jgi:hypothetical protein
MSLLLQLPEQREAFEEFLAAAPNRSERVAWCACVRAAAGDTLLVTHARMLHCVLQRWGRCRTQRLMALPSAQQ